MGVIIGKNGVRMEKKKVQEVIEWPVPKSVKEVQKFFGASKLLQTVCERFCYNSKALT